MPITSTFFEPCEPEYWRGRYARVPGEKSVFHLKHYDGRRRAAIYWQTDEGTATCYALESEPEQQLARAVESAKRMASGGGGGSFVINEFGQVLVPSSNGGGVRVLAGQLHGNLLFDNPFDPDSPIDLSDTEGLVAGDPWKLPYVGMPFLLTARREITFQHFSEDGKERLFPPAQDKNLADQIYSVRGSGGRFIVNPAGVVLTKRQDFEQGGQWSPVFVGHTNSNKWFKQEEVK